MKSPRKAPKSKPQLSIPVEVAEFERLLRNRGENPAGLGDFFEKKPFWVARVPARLDVMGGSPITPGQTFAKGRVGAGCSWRCSRAGSAACAFARGPWAARPAVGKPAFRLICGSAATKFVAYEKVRDLFRENHLASWAAYVGGSLFALIKEEKLRLRGGFDVLILSAVPMNAGVASSAAVEIGALCAFNACLGLGLDPARLARLGQIAENRVVGAPCGIMDQIAIASGRRGQLVHILCRPGAVVDAVEIPAGMGFVGINSMVRHSVAAAPYGDVRVGAFMGKRILNDLRARDGLPAAKHLTEISDKEFAARSRHLPETLKGSEFLKRYGSHGDAATTIRPGATYRVRGPTRHAVRENERVLRFIAALRRGGESGVWRGPRDVRRARELSATNAAYRCRRWMCWWPRCGGAARKRASTAPRSPAAARAAPWRCSGVSPP
jgi:L-arabinokinase